MPTVTETIEGPDGTPLQYVDVTVRLIASTSGEAAGYVSASNTTVLGSWATRTGADGVASLTLIANSLLNPSNTVYQWTRKAPGRPPVTSYISVPNGAGPYVVEDLLTEMPGSLPDPATLNPLSLPYLVGAPSGGDDTATLVAALASGRSVQLSDGDYQCSPDALAIATDDQKLKGLGRLTQINFTGDGTWGIKIDDVGRAAIEDVYINCGSHTITYGCGVSATGSAQGSTFRGVSVYGGVNAFAVSPDNPNDVAFTHFFGCAAREATSAGYRIGNGSSGNVLNTHLFGCSALGSQYGVIADGSGFTWHGGDVGRNSVADFYLGTPAANVVAIEGVRSEASARLWQTGGPSSTLADVSIRDVRWQADALTANGRWIEHQVGGSLLLENVTCFRSLAVVPVIRTNCNGQLGVTLIGVAQAAALASAVSTGGSGGTYTFVNYQQVDGNGALVATSSSIAVAPHHLTHEPGGSDALTSYATGGLFKIYETTLNADNPQFDFPNIPQTYAQLVVIARVRSTRAGVNSDTLQVAINGNTTDASYSRQLLRANGATTTSTEAIGVAGSRALALIPAATATAGHISRCEVLIPGYTGSFVKGLLSRAVTSLGMTTGLLYVEHNTTIFSSSTAINQLTFTPLVGPNFLAGSVISVYGITAGV